MKTCEICSDPVETIRHKFCPSCKKLRNISARSRYNKKTRIIKAAKNDAYRKRNLPKYAKIKQSFRHKLKIEILEAYGGKNPICSCPGCDESRIEFLCIDHLNGGGSQHKQNIADRIGHGDKSKVGSGQIRADLKRLGFPPIVQILCHNCNSVKSDKKACPIHRISY